MAMALTWLIHTYAEQLADALLEEYAALLGEDVAEVELPDTLPLGLVE